MSQRFFAENLAVGSHVNLAGDEARHLAAVMRAAVGDEITLFDGSGAEFVARITQIKKSGIDLQVEQRQEIARELPFELTLAVALPRGERQKWLVEKLTELGVTRLVPIATERGVAVAGDAALERLRRQVVEASKQCGRNRLMEIDPPARAEEFFRVQSVPGQSAGAVRLLADPGGTPLEGSPTHGPKKPWVIAVGPEGGFTGAEVSAAREGNWSIVSLGPRLLRVETAAVAMAAYAALR